jgi:tripartite-type tricarboxylate transporter receptor subunit TctC
MGITTMSSARADDYPNRPVHVIVGFDAGGGTDFLARLIAQKLSDRWGQAVIVENRVGADGTIAEDAVARSAPDGYTVAWITNAHTITATQFKLGYDPIKSFAPVIRVGFSTDVLLVNPTVPVKSVKDLIDYAKANPRKLNFGAGGTADPAYLEAELFMKLAGIDMVPINYKGGAEIVTGLVGGEVQVYFGSLASSQALISAGKVKPLAVASASRSSILPNLPTIAEAGSLPGYEGSTWYGVLVPSATPPQIVNKLHDDIAAVVQLPDVQSAMKSRGIVTVAGTADELRQTISDDIAKWSSFATTTDAK